MTRNKRFLLLVNQQMIVIKMSYAKYIVDIVIGMGGREREGKTNTMLCYCDSVIFKSLNSQQRFHKDTCIVVRISFHPYQESSEIFGNKFARPLQPPGCH